MSFKVFKRETQQVDDIPGELLKNRCNDIKEQVVNLNDCKFLVVNDCIKTEY